MSPEVQLQAFLLEHVPKAFKLTVAHRDSSYEEKEEEEEEPSIAANSSQDEAANSNPHES